MILLLPPSETKISGGKKAKENLSFPELDTARALVKTHLLNLCQDEVAAMKSLKLGPRLASEVEVNLDLKRPVVLPAIKRYTGVLYDALCESGFTATMEKNAKRNLFIQSSLFGLINAMDEIPNYRLSAGSKLPGVNLKTVWNKAHQEIFNNLGNKILLDFRSKAYLELAPIPTTHPSYQVEVLVEDSTGKRRPLNHFNKKTKGQFVREILRQRSAPKTEADLAEIAIAAGLKAEFRSNQLLLITNG
jgi:uncharacterized protein